MFSLLSGRFFFFLVFPYDKKSAQKERLQVTKGTKDKWRVLFLLIDNLHFCVKGAN